MFLEEQPDRQCAPHPADRQPGALRMVPFRDVPIVINSFNRLGCLRRLVDWFLQAGHTRIHLVDNASTYPPLLRYLEELERRSLAPVVRLDTNVGHLAIWQRNLLDRLGIDTEYVYTDPDVVPAESCPSDLIGFLQSILAANPDIGKAGIGLRLDEIPDTYRYKAQVISWERQFWLAPVAAGLFRAPIDTTFALYRPRAGPGMNLPSIRTGWPYLAAHESWYVNHADLSAEDLFYQDTAARNISHWSVPEVPAWLQAAAADHAARRPCLLYAGPVGQDLPGYLPVPHAGPVPLADDTVDGIYIADSLERLAREPLLAKELHRVAKPGARMVLHPRRIGVQDMLALIGRAAGGAGGWRMAQVTFAADQLLEAGAGVDLAELVRRYPATLRGMLVHLRATKPGHDSAAAEPSPPKIVFSNLDRWAGFSKVDE